jgi:A/G-specific adenine glycosylase
MMKARQLAEFRSRLFGWYAANKRAMPWRGVRDPYRIWLSEVMLQQTRAAVAVDYYRRFLRRFPTVRALARARQSAVLEQWAGLGYYSRARNLHRAAKEIVAKHNGRFPRTLDAALALPGVGGYTAAAVLSIAYGQPHAVLDGNVGRVLARLYAVRGDLRAGGRWRKLQSLADGLLPKQGAQAGSPCHTPGDWNQAMMELGATVCTPRAPRCDACPVARWCRARKLGVAEQLPAARRTPATEHVHIAAAVLLDPRGRTLLVPPNGASPDGLFSRLWQFPAVENKGNLQGSLDVALRGMRIKGLTQRPQRSTKEAETARHWIALNPVNHTVTFRKVTIGPHLLRIAALPRVAGARTPRLDQLDRLAVSSATRKIARRALEHFAASPVPQESASA